MKRFITSVIIFVTVICTAVLFLFFIQNRLVQHMADFAFPQHVTMVVVGHSIPECAYNDGEIENFKNFSSSGESYFYSFSKIRHVLVNNPQIETIFIEYTNNQLDEAMNQWIWGDRYMNHKFPRFAPFLLFKDHLLLVRKNISAYISAMAVSLKHNAKTILKNETNFIQIMGGYKDLYRKNSVDTATITIAQLPKFLEEKDTKVSQYNLSYLRKSIDLCQQHGVNVVLIRSPLHPHYQRLKNHKKFSDVLSTYFSDVDLLDFHAFPLGKDEFADMQHLNHFGATKFSKWFNNMLTDGLLEKSDKQGFIDMKIAAYRKNVIDDSRVHK